MFLNVYQNTVGKNEGARNISLNITTYLLRHQVESFIFVESKKYLENIYLLENPNINIQSEQFFKTSLILKYCGLVDDLF